MLLLLVFPANACGCRARGLERELRASGRHKKRVAVKIIILNNKKREFGKKA
jgi:hypothetical protein